MSAAVRMFAYAGIAQANVADYQGQQSFNSVTLYKEPYLAGQMITAGASALPSTSALSPSGSKLLRIQVEPGKRVHYEISLPSNDVRPATTESPIIEGNDQVWWTSGAIISLLEAT